MHYTIDHNSQIDAQVRKDLALISDAVRDFAGDEFVALFLVGGFGRGEGGVVRRDGRWLPANDYDLELVSRKPGDAAALGALCQKLAERIGVKWVHVENHAAASLPRMKFTMYNYDLKYASSLVCGDGGVLETIPRMDPSKMPWREAQGQIFTRLWAFIGPFHPRMLGRELTPEERFFLAGQLSKAILAAQDAYLIANGLYDSSYRARRDRLEKTGAPNELKELSGWAAEFKLSPHQAPIPDMIDLYFRVRPLYLEAVRRMYDAAFPFRVGSLTLATFLMRYAPYALLKRAYFFLVKRSHWYVDYLHYDVAVIYLVKSRERDRVDPRDLKIARRFMSKVKGFRKDVPVEWGPLREEALRLRETLWH